MLRGISTLKGIVSVVQTPFTDTGHIDFESLKSLVEDAIISGADGLLVPAVASEVAFLSDSERKRIFTTVLQAASSRVPVIAGASYENPASCRIFARWASGQGAVACLVAVPVALYMNTENIVPFFQEVSRGVGLSMIVQDFEFNGPGLTLHMIRKLKHKIPSMTGIKVEPTPAGPKYTAVREALGDDFLIAGGWAVSQFIEALDRGVDAIIPESSMIRVYKRIQQCYKQGKRESAIEIFNRLLSILSFTNQEVGNSILFFKHLVVRKGIFQTTNMRYPQPQWDSYSLRLTEELIERYLELEEESL
ncbi:L-2-keto-3-deoxyarabonate dehydratase [subsurface metagenome]